jgi:hypothetical protein
VAAPRARQTGGGSREVCQRTNVVTRVIDPQARRQRNVPDHAVASDRLRRPVRSAGLEGATIAAPAIGHQKQRLISTNVAIGTTAEGVGFEPTEPLSARLTAAFSPT